MAQEKAIKDFTIHGTAQIPLHLYQQFDPEGKLSIPYHWHDELEWIYVEEGRLLLTVNGETLEGQAGDVFFINSQELHRLEARNSHPSVHHALVFSPDILGFSYDDDCQSKYIRPLQDHLLVLSRSTSLNPAEKQQLCNLFRELFTIYRKKQPGWYLAVKSCIYRILSLAVSAKLLQPAPDTFSHRDHRADQVKKVLSYIHDHFDKPVSLTELAAILHMNPQYFCRFFKNAAGKTPIEYLKEYRLQQARGLLENSSLSVLEICMRSGFESPSYFIREFRLLYGITPGEYQKQFRALPHCPPQ